MMKVVHLYPALQTDRVAGRALALVGSAWLGLAAAGLAAAQATGPQAAPPGKPLYTYTLTQDGTPASYDEAMVAASLQGIINWEAPELYVLSHQNTRPQFWLDLLSKDGRWLEGRERKPLADLGALVHLAGDRLKGAIIWDPAVPASINVATTVAGVRDGVVLSPEFADRYLPEWHLPVLLDLRGRFTGAETGSKKNDAYRWAIREYLAKGLCPAHLLCLFEDAFSTRAGGNVGYVVTRDWAVRNRSFVFDLSPWGDERPADDPGQRLGLDLETYRMILEETLRHTAGRQMTEMTGFFVFTKYSHFGGHASTHEPVPTEWETVHLITPYNVYQNTSSSDCYNQSLHSQAPRRDLRQRHDVKPVPLEKKAYLCVFMADYDSAYVLYDFLPKHWDDPNRGKIPLAWGINPNLLETYPDLIAYFYSTASTADTFTADASAAGYVNPNRIRPEHLPLFIRHNQAFFREADMTIAPMVLDWDQPTPAVKDAFQQFAPDGYGTIIWDMHTDSGKPVEPQVWKGMPILELINDANECPGAEQTADIMANAIAKRGNRMPGFYLFRIVWVNPTTIADSLAILHRKHPDLNFELLDPYTFFALFRKAMAQ
jgi:hypothetical protein